MKNESIKISKIPSSLITPREVYFSRRQALQTLGAFIGGSLLAACTPSTTVSTKEITGRKDEVGDPATPQDEISGFTNYYEFTTSKTGVARLSEGFTTDPWRVEIGGLVQKPKTYNLDDLLRLFDQEERIYRMRCVEGWSMVVPWNGFPLSVLLSQVVPTMDAKYVSFETVFRPDQMSGLADISYPWPYTEGLRLDEAMHPLTLMATGIYGDPLLPSNGAPVRLVVPWKYGYKSIKSIVKITLTETQPATFWNTIASDEYGFYSNVNPERSHPRWSQASEQRHGETGLRKTQRFNGYEKEVASLYQGMDLIKNY